VAEALANNSTLRSIDMRQNNIGIAGLMALSLSLKLNHSMFQLAYDVDDTMVRYKPCVAFVFAFLFAFV
jgi:hypothetical protein